MKKSSWLERANPSGQTIIAIACISRCFVWLFSYVIHHIIEDYDTSSGLLTSTPQSAIFNIFGQFIKWDAIYFIGIAENGYKCEQFFAFMPGFPSLIKLGASGTFKCDEVHLQVCFFFLLGV